MVVFQDGARKVHRLLLNTIKTNCYIIERHGDAILIDPTDQEDQIAQYLADHNLNLIYMIATHGHFDHISAAGGLIEKGLADKLYLHEKELPEVKRARISSKLVMKRNMKVPAAEKFDDALMQTLKEWGLKAEHMGGHSRGSVVFYDLAHNFIFTGDLNIHHRLNITIFNSLENVEEFACFVEKIKKDFKPNTIIFPGHGNVTNVLDELRENKKWAYVLEKRHESK